jgi:drug/metabolite transporter (DMT)-like permease
LIRIGLSGLEPLQLAAARFGLAAVIVLAWLIAFRPKLPSLRDAGLFLASGASGIALYNALLNSGQQTVSAGAASFLINTSPILTALLAALFLRERYGLWGWIGSALAFFGVAIIATGQVGGFRLGAGASLVLGAALCQATYFILQRPLVPRYGALACTAYTILAGALLLTPWVGPAAARLAAAGPSSSALWAVVALAVLPSAIGYAAWTYALDHYGASRAANFLYLVPPTAMLIAFALTREVPALTTLIGGTLAIAGVALVNLRRKLPPVVASPASNAAT